MNDKLKAALDKAKNQWNKWSKVQKGIFGGVIALIVVAVIVLGTVSTQDGRVSLFNAPINDTQAFERIVTRLEEENVPFTTTADGRNVNQFTVTDFEQKEKVRLAIAKDLEALLKSLDDVDNASVKIAMPETELFAEDNKPVTASVVITPSFSSDLVTNRAKIEGIERLVTRAIPRIDRENITITDNSGIELNSKNFQVVDRLHLTEAQLKIKQKAEKLLYEKVKRVLTNNGVGSAPIPPSRISISPVEIDMQFNEESYIYDEMKSTTVRDLIPKGRPVWKDRFRRHTKTCKDWLHVTEKIRAKAVTKPAKNRPQSTKRRGKSTEFRFLY